ncbi:MAG: universal stress protein [Acidobacteriota bacterium]
MEPTNQPAQDGKNTDEKNTDGRASDETRPKRADGRRPILVGTSLETGSDPAVRAGFEIARRAGLPLHLYHGHPIPTAFQTAPDPASASPDIRCESDVRQRLLNEQLDRLGHRRTDIDAVDVAVGTPHRLLLEAAADRDAGLLVLGARETDRPAWLGSTADRVLRSVRCPVWVVDGEPLVPPRRVLAPVDLSHYSRDSLIRGLEVLAGAGDPAPDVEVLFVLTPKEIEKHPHDSAAEIRLRREEELRTFTEELATGGRFTFGHTVREGDVRAEIVGAAVETSSDLLVLGTRALSGFERFLLGSVSADVAARARVSALIVPPRPPRPSPAPGDDPDPETP